MTRDLSNYPRYHWNDTYTKTQLASLVTSSTLLKIIEGPMLSIITLMHFV